MKVFTGTVLVIPAAILAGDSQRAVPGSVPIKIIGGLLDCSI
ncbi:MAG: hypothetical protein U5L72_18150 [Bacteroidales bacterium]|nr:hypothetical protein [Bacteroidales bacterium]